jgi:hypothetical protein
VQRRRNVNAKGLQSPVIYDQFDLSWPHDRKLRRFRSLENLTSVNAGLTVSICNIRSIADKCNQHVRFVPCVDGSEVARTFFTFAASVGAAMCSASSCGARGRWA